MTLSVCSLKKNSRTYFYSSFLAYIFGLGLTIFVMHTFKHAQVRHTLLSNPGLVCGLKCFHEFDYLSDVRGEKRTTKWLRVTAAIKIQPGGDCWLQVPRCQPLTTEGGKSQTNRAQYGILATCPVWSNSEELTLTVCTFTLLLHLKGLCKVWPLWAPLTPQPLFTEQFSAWWVGPALWVWEHVSMWGNGKLWWPGR